MKKIYLSLLIVVFALSLEAQIVINENNVAPVGSTVVIAYDSVPDATIVPGDAGGNKVWNFSALHEHYYDTLYMVSPETTPFGQSFPDANYVSERVEGQDTSYAYFVKNSDAMTLLGYSGYSSQVEDTVVVNIVPGDTVLDFPVQYGNHREESYYYQIVMASPSPGIDSVRYKRSTDKTTDVDAWGTMTIPGGTYDVLRRKTVFDEADSTWVLLFGSWTLLANNTYTSTSYEWLTNQVTPGFTLVSIDIDEGNITGVNFLKGNPVGIKQKEVRNLDVYPNPATGRISFETDKHIDGKLTIYNGSGNKIFEKTVSGSKFHVNVSKLIPGTYFVILDDHYKGTVKYSGKFIKR